MNFEHIQLSSIEEFQEYFTGWDYRYLQLSPGALNCSATIVDLSGVQLHWHQFDAKILVRESLQKSDLWFGFHRDCSSLPIYWGKEFDFGNALVWHAGKEQEYVVPKSTVSLVIRVDAWLVEQLGWSIKGESLQSVSPQLLRRLAERCRIASAVRTPDDATQLRDQILDAMEPALAPWLEPPLSLVGKGFQGSHYYRAFKEASLRIESGQIDAIEELAEPLGISKRTLYRAFRQCLGIGPYAYLQTIRLHELRNRLLEASLDDSSVTRLAFESGFNEMGRMSVTYRKYFGESPYDTLKRG